MKKINKPLIGKVLLIAMSIQTLLLGISFIVQICRIYFAEHIDNQIYTRAICGKYLKEMSVVIILWLILIIICWLYFHFNKVKEDKVKPNNVTRLQNLLRIAPEFANPALQNEYRLINRGLKKQKIAWLISFIIIVLCSIMGLMYIFNVKHFDVNGNLMQQAKDMSIYLLPWVVISFISLIVAMIYEEYQAKALIDLLKLIIKNDGRKIKAYKENYRRKKYINIARVAIICIAIALIIIGVADGGASGVLRKAINICTECIGIG